MAEHNQLGKAHRKVDAMERMRGITRYFAKNPPLARSRSVPRAAVSRARTAARVARRSGSPRTTASRSA